ncbi:thiamine pyrophosphate-binding protein [Candidatus Solirubrobacter pratensis]|uniref:thiamine pyrophosphate-binding protein n=1 Tax=Candidatus Solirubrobacter pratensis TaxID=1298857 RepID=UPI00041E68AA|nr:thiamine pyrophosphate-binding protein [Candidatus Solirubrobacter pratensis]
MDASPTVAEAIAAEIVRAGVARVFGFPGGGGNLDLMDAFGAAGVEFVLARSEGSAALMGCAHAELTGRPAVVVVGSGPGLASVVNGVANAHLDRVPLVVISDRQTDAEAATTGHQLLDQRALLAPVTKWGTTLQSAGAASSMRRALGVASAYPRGPVHLDLPRATAGEPARPGPEPELQPGAVTADLDAIATGLGAAERPLLLIGLEAARGVDQRDVVELVRRLRCPVLTTYKAKGVVPESDGAWAGILSGGELERPLLERADALLGVGLDPVELLTKPWPYEAPFYALREAGLGDEYFAPAASAAGALGELAAQLWRALPERTTGTWTRAEIERCRDGVLPALDIRADHLNAGAVVDIVRRHAPDAIVAVDAGAHMLPVTTTWRVERPGRFLISNGLATMGFAVPAAIAAAALDRDAVVVAFTGDGGLAYNLAELETARRLGVRVVVVVFNDSSLSLIRIKLQATGRPGTSLDLAETDFSALARGFGCEGEIARTPQELSDAMARALAREHSTVLDARLSGLEYGPLLKVIRG